MSVKSWSSLGGGGGDKEPPIRQNTDDIVKMGYLKKLKTMKRKYFVLRKDSDEASARLEYYDSEKKFRANNRPKRSITLKTCFNINKRNDTRQKWVIALYTQNDCFCLVLESEAELEDWLKNLLTLQLGEDIPDGEPPRPTFEHVWQVVVQKKELGHSKNILGPYHLCLTDKTLSLVKMGPNSEKAEPIEFSLHSIRRCGELESFFYLELGQMAVTGAGNLWMQTEDNNIAQNMHAAILSACKRNSQKDLAPKARHRSSSATEASKPITVNLRWSAAHPEEGSRPVVHSKSQRYGPIHENSTPALNSETVSHSGVMGVGRERCASMPSRPRTSSEGGHRCPPFARPSSIYNSSYSPQMTDLSPVSPEREGLTDSSLSMEGDGMEFAEGSWHGRDCENRLGHSLTPEEPVILEESNEDCMRWPSGEEERTNNPQRERSLCLPIQNNNMHYRKISPNSTSGFKPSSPSQASLSDMYSPPCGSSPLETSSAYMPMSPGERGMTGVRVGGAHSANHSRGSSLAEEGYVPMAPSIHDDGYVDMDIHGRSNRNLAEHFRDGELSASSSCSITSGTPSTDVRFPEYTLEKVSTYITPSEDDLTPSERPARAYSVGSRPMLNKRTDILNQSECQQRTRAFSVGSRCPRLPPESTLPPSRRALSSSHSSVEPSDDLMEIDFSKNNKRRNRFFKKPSSAERLLVPPNGSVTSSVASSYSTAEGSSYMDMSPRASPKLYDNKEQPASDYVHASSPKTHDLKFGRSPPTSFVASSSPPVIGFSSVLGQVPEGETGFIEPRPVDQVRLFHHGRSPPTASAAPSFASPLRRARSPSEQEEAAYMPMQPVETKSVVAKTSRPRVDSFPVAETSRLSNAPKTSSLPIKTTINNLSHSLKSIKDECSDVNALKRKSSSVEDNNNTKMMMTGTTPMEVPMQRSNEDYVQMAPDGRSIRRVSLDSGCGSSRNEDYMNMTPGNGNGKHQQQQSRNGRKDRTRFNSQPIAIRPTTSGAVPVATYNGVRKLSSGTPPKVPSYLGLSSGSSPSSSPYSSLSRRRSKTEGLARSESRESNGLSTPDTGASTPIFRISLNSPISPNGPAVPSSFDSAAKCPVDATDGSVRISHQQPSSSSNQSDYINYNPSREVSSSYDDYMPMQPGKPPEPVRKISAPPVFDREPVSASAAPVVDDVVANLGGLVLNSAAAAAVPRSDCSTIVESPAEAVVAAATQRQNGLEAACSLPPPSTDRLCSCPPPPTAEKELHYASLDLVKPEDGGGRQGGSGGGTNLRNQSSTSSASTPSPNPQQNTSTATFTYAEIDFSKNIH